MKVTARTRYSAPKAKSYKSHLLVKSNPFGAVRIPFSKHFGSKEGQHFANSITAYVWVDAFGMYDMHDAIHYQTVTDFLADWHILQAETRHIRIPFLRVQVGLGDAFAFFAERLPLWFKLKFNGCMDRREWWNWLLQFQPMSSKQAVKSTVQFDNTMDIRRLLRFRGIDPYNLADAPKCDSCKQRAATHVVEGEGAAFLVCNDPHCEVALGK